MPISANACLVGDVTRRKRCAHVPVADQEALARALALLGASRIANNLNQLAYRANTGSLVVDEEMRAQIGATYTHVRLIRDELVCALGLVEG